MKIFKIPPSKEKDKLVNENNLVKLTGYGKDVASVINFVIRHFQETNYPNLSKNWFTVDELYKRMSIDVHVHPKQWASDLEFKDIISEREHLRVSSAGSTFMEIDGRITHLDPKGRPIYVYVYPNRGGETPRGDIFIYWMDDPAVGPLRTCISTPIEYVVDQLNNFTREHVVYLHSICPMDISPSSYSDDFTLNYIGLTKQGWKKRFSQHMNNARSGSPLLFHRALRDYYVGSRLAAHRVLSICETEKKAMDNEELLVQGGNREDFHDPDAFQKMDKWHFGTLYPKGLNMIPGGYAGLKVLHKMGALKDDQPLDIDQRDKILISCLEHEERKGRSNPLLAAHWNNEDYATKIICGPEGRLKPDQIEKARTFGFLGREISEIKNIVGAKNERQIQNLLSGRTYSRIKKPH
jgi:hypothetical protein